MFDVGPAELEEFESGGAGCPCPPREPSVKLLLDVRQPFGSSAIKELTILRKDAVMRVRTTGDMSNDKGP